MCTLNTLMCIWATQGDNSTPARSYLTYFRPTKFKTHYVASQFFIFRRTVKLRHISFIEMRTYFSFGLILRDIPNSITPQTTLRLLPIPVGLMVLPCTRQCSRSPLTPSPPFFTVPDRGTDEGLYLCPRQACSTSGCSKVHVYSC